jgi:hypothetical protein
MAAEETLAEVTIVTGDAAIAQILKQQAALVIPAFAWRYDGFVNDVFSEYANPSILRPPSVRKAQLCSELSAYFYREDVDEQTAAQAPPMDERFDLRTVRCLPAAGNYYVGWTMYDDADVQKEIYDEARMAHNLKF